MTILKGQAKSYYKAIIQQYEFSEVYLPNWQLKHVIRLKNEAK